MSRPLNVCMISGSFEYDSETSLGAFIDYAQSFGAVNPTLIVYKNEEDDRSLAPLDEADVALVFTRRLNVEGVELARFQQYCAGGRPLVGVRTASHAFQKWLAFDKEVLGGNYEGHFGAGPLCRVSAARETSDHPILEGVSEWNSLGSLYKNTPISPDATLLLTGSIDASTQPVAWTRLHRGGRVFYTSLGHPADFGEPSFLRLLHNAILWAGGIL